MPKIDTFIAGGKTTSFQAPGTGRAIPAPNVPVEDFSPLSRAGAQITQFGDDLNRLGLHLKAQQDEIDAAGMVGTYNGRVKELAIEVDGDTESPLDRPAEYKKRLQKSIDEITKSSKSGGAQAAFSRYVALHRPTNEVDYHAHSLAAGVKVQVGRLESLADEYSRAASQAANPVQRDELIGEYLGLLDRAGQNRILDPVQVAAVKKTFREKSTVDFMSHLRSTDPDKLFELEKAGAFVDVPVTKRDAILDRAERERAAEKAQAQVHVDRAMTVWRESIERETEKHVFNGTLTQSWLEEHGYALSSEKVGAYYKALKEQVSGVSTGDPAVERVVHGMVYDRHQNPRTTMDRVAGLYFRGEIGKTNYSVWSTYLRAEIDRQDDKGKAVSEKRDKEKEQLETRRFQEAKDQLELSLRSTGSFEKFDQAAGEALSQGREELARRSNYLGEGREDSLAVYRDMLPRLVSQVENRVASRQTFLELQLGPTRTRAQLRAQQGSMRPEEYERKIGYLEEYVGINKEMDRLRGLLKKPDQRPSERWQK